MKKLTYPFILEPAEKSCLETARRWKSPEFECVHQMLCACAPVHVRELRSESGSRLVRQWGGRGGLLESRRTFRCQRLPCQINVCIIVPCTVFPPSARSVPTFVASKIAQIETFRNFFFSSCIGFYRAIHHSKKVKQMLKGRELRLYSNRLRKKKT